MHFSRKIFGNDAILENVFVLEQVEEMQKLDHDFLFCCHLVRIYDGSLLSTVL